MSNPWRFARRPGRWRSRWALASMLLLAALGAPAISTSAAREVPTLGVRGIEGPQGRGWGEVKPKMIFNGGDPSGLVDHIRWRRWGSRAAIGVGRNSIFRPSGGYYPGKVRIVLRASRPRHCTSGARHLAYSRLSFRVPRRPGGPLPRRWSVWNSDMCRRLGSYRLERHGGGLPRVSDGVHFSIRPMRMSGWTGDGSEELGGPSSELPVGYYPGGSFGKIDWRAWTSRRAYGRAVLWADDCEPDCGSGSWEGFPTRVSLRRVRAGHFTRLKFACDCFHRPGYHELFEYRTPYPPQWSLVRSWRSAGD